CHWALRAAVRDRLGRGPHTLDPSLKWIPLSLTGGAGAETAWLEPRIPLRGHSRASDDTRADEEGLGGPGEHPQRGGLPALPEPHLVRGRLRRGALRVRQRS